MLAHMLQYSCLENPLSDREASLTGSQRVGLKQRCSHRHKTFLPVSSAPVRGEHEGGAAV